MRLVKGTINLFILYFAVSFCFLNLFIFVKLEVQPSFSLEKVGCLICFAQELYLKVLLDVILLSLSRVWDLQL